MSNAAVAQTGLLRRRILIASLIIGFAWLSFFSVRSGFAYVHQFRLNTLIDSWQSNPGKRLSLAAWQQMEAEALDALASYSVNPDIENALGRLDDYRALMMATTADEKAEYHHQAIDHYRRVIALRPAWPYGYLNMANSKAMAGELDAEFRKVLVQLSRLAPWENNTLPGIVRLATFSWPYLDIATRNAIRPYLMQAGEKRSGDVRKALDKDQLHAYCKVVVPEFASSELCR